MNNKKIIQCISKDKEIITHWNEKDILNLMLNLCKIEYDYVEKLNIDLNILNEIISNIFNSAKNNQDKIFETQEFFELIAKETSYFIQKGYEFSQLSGRILIKYLHDNTPSTFSSSMKELYFYNNSINESFIRKNFYEIVDSNKEFLNGLIKKERDFDFDYLSIMTLMKQGYLLGDRDRSRSIVLETPQYLFLRVSLELYSDYIIDENGNLIEIKIDFENLKECYDSLSEKKFIHGSPTLFNAGTEQHHYSSCYLITPEEDSIDAIYDCDKEYAKLSKGGGAASINVTLFRCNKSTIKGTNGMSKGIVPWIGHFSHTAKIVDQGGNKRPGALAVYLEPWHSDLIDFLNIKNKLNISKEYSKYITHSSEEKCTNVFLGLWIPDLFFERLLNDDYFPLFCPKDVKELLNLFGEDFKKKFIEYEEKKIYKKKVTAKLISQAIVDTLIENGLPYLLFGDHCNRRSNQKNVGVIKSSNLCTEIIEYSNGKQTAVCNIASISLPRCLKFNKELKKYQFDFNELNRISKLITRNLNRVILKTKYLTEKSKNSNMDLLPIGIGIQGLADIYFLLNLSYDSKDAIELRLKIMEMIYFSSLEQSMELSKIYGPYKFFKGSPASEGILQFDMIREDILKGNIKKPSNFLKFDKEGNIISPLNLPWKQLKNNIIKFGLRNSLLVAPMPTATTSQILGNYESHEPVSSNFFKKQTLSGEYTIVNRYMLDYLKKKNILTEELMNSIISNYGSVQHLKFDLTDWERELFRTVWEIPIMNQIDSLKEASYFIDQNTSFNIYIPNKYKNYERIMKIIHYSWASGLKGLYYCRTQSSINEGNYSNSNKNLKLMNQLRNFDEKGDNNLYPICSNGSCEA